MDGLRLAMFDVDGTLIDSQQTIVEAMTAAFVEFGLPAPPQIELRRNIGLSVYDGLARILPDGGEELHRRIAETYRGIYNDLCARPGYDDGLFPGAAEALDALEEAGWLLGIATGKARRGLDPILERLRFTDRFVTVQTGDANPGKPSPAMLERAYSETGIGPGGMAMIGDTVYDIMMARNARVPALGVVWGYHPGAELVAAGAQLLAQDFAEVPSLLERLVPAPSGRATAHG